MAGRLCAACGMCCNGVLFSGMRLQPEDSAKTLARLGLRAKKRKDGLHIPQPCPAHRDSCCSIYADRPVRCRNFKCRQLLELENGSIDSDAAMEKIRYAQMLVETVQALLVRAGDSRGNKPLAVRVEAVFTPPLEQGPEAASARDALHAAMTQLEATLANDFRVDDDLHPTAG